MKGVILAEQGKSNEALGHEPGVVSDDHLTVGTVSTGNHVGDRVHADANVGVRELVGDDGSPAGCSKTDHSFPS